ncbi:MAG: hypothetical protein QNJ29_03220 [Rhizobiaceae bacterium]|nr:hypothetical protein [Rhizobiaceae bacterium]
MNTAEIILSIVNIWIMIGGVIAFVFLLFGIDRIDEDARGAYVFRPLLIPGILLIWPMVLWRWLRLEMGTENWARRHKPPRKLHFWVAILFAISIPLIMLLGWSARQTWPESFEPQRISLLQQENVR